MMPVRVTFMCMQCTPADMQVKHSIPHCLSVQGTAFRRNSLCVRSPAHLWASNPAETMMMSGLKLKTAGRICVEVWGGMVAMRSLNWKDVQRSADWAI